MYKIGYTGDKIDWVIDMDKLDVETITVAKIQFEPHYADAYMIVDGKPVLAEEHANSLKRINLKSKLTRLDEEVFRGVETKELFKKAIRLANLLRKESEGECSLSELGKIRSKKNDSIRKIATCYQRVRSYLEDPSRTLEEIRQYDVKIDPSCN